MQWASQVVLNGKEHEEMWVQSVSGEDPLEEGISTHSSILAWSILCMENPMYGEAWQATVHGVTKSQKRLSIHAAEIISQSFLLKK